MNKADQLLTLATIRQVEFQRVATWMLRDILVQLEDLMDVIAAKALTADLSAKNARTRRRNADAFESEIEELILEVTEEIRKRMESDFTELLKFTVKDERNNFLLIYGLALTGTPATSGADMLVAGSTVGDHLEITRLELIFRIMARVRDSVAAGEAEELLYRRLKGSATQAGEIVSTQRRVEALTRTAMTAIPNQVTTDLKPRENVIAAHGFEHVSVLDQSTSDICRGRAWKRWNADYKPIGHKLPFRQPPLHDHCRSKILLIFIDDPTPEEFSFKQWLAQLKPNEQNAVFGEENMISWKAGKITDSNLVRQSDRPLPIEDLKMRQGEFPYL